ncbi:MAG: 2-hydroxychromene-2-carboxylate isomerase [Pseudomonadota bacterium]
MAHIDYFFFTLSPFTYLAGDGLEKIAEKHGASVTYKPIALMKVFEATGGTPPAQRHESRKTYRMQELVRIAKMNRMEINPTPAFFPTNPAPSSYALIAAQEAGGGDIGGLLQSYLKAVWVEEKDVAEDAVVKAALEANGFDPSLADTGLMKGAEVFEKNTEEAIQRHVFGSPSYLVGDEIFWGQDRLSYLDAYLGAM